MAPRIGVDVGGTFTDLIFYDDESGEIRVGKAPTPTSAPENGVLAAVAAAVPAERVGATEYFLHGTTVGLNSLLTRTGAVVGLVLGLVLKAVGVVQNPFWLMSAALVTGAALALGQAASRAERRPPDDDV